VRGERGRTVPAAGVDARSFAAAAEPAGSRGARDVPFPRRVDGSTADACEAFRGWLRRWRESPGTADFDAGRELLAARRTAMAELIRNDPEAAIRNALTFAERDRLPAGWLAMVEERFSESGDLAVLPACPPADPAGARMTFAMPGRPPL